jgi:TolA-binding protein
MKKPNVLLAVSFVLLTSWGCFIYDPTASFVQARYTNVVAYFNTFYNAQRLFTEAEDAVIAAEIEYRELPGQTRPFAIPTASRSKFTSSIEKNSKVLSFYPTSKWVDDALLMIGKAYYYTGDDVRAQRKFYELAAQYPGGDFAVEGQLWLGRSLLRQKQYAQGIAQLEALLGNTVTGFSDIAGLAAYELGKYYYEQNETERSLQYYSRALPLVRDGSLNALIQFQIGVCHERLQQFEKAERAYAAVSDHDPGYTLLFHASLYRIKMISAQGRFDEALAAFNTMLDDTKNSDFYGAIHFEIANSMMAKGEVQDAIQKYIFVDTAYARTDVAARSYFILGKHFETVEINYDSARTYYNKARTEFPASPITPDAALKAEIFNKYDQLRKDLFRFDSLLTHTVRQKVIDDSLLALVIDSVAVQDSAAVQQQIKKATPPGKKSDAKRDSIPPIDSTKIKAQMTKNAAYRIMVDSLQRSIVRTKFEFGGLFFSELQLADSALYWFHLLVRNHPQSEFIPRTLYTIAEIYRSLKPQPQEVRDSLYRYIITLYPQSPYADESGKNLGIAPKEAQKDSALDLFERGERFTDEGKYESAIMVFREIHRKFPGSPMSPKALYTIGWHYENSTVQNDSALSVYKKLMTDYPTSQFAQRVRPKVNEFENEIKRQEQEKQQILDQQKKDMEEKEQQRQSHIAKPDSLITPNKNQ